MLRPACVWKIWFWLLILFPAFLQVWNLPIVSVPWGIWSHWVLSLWNLEMWLCWHDEGDWWRGVLFFHFRVSPGYRQSIAGNTWVACLVLSCRCCCYCCWFCWSCCCCCCCLPSHYRAACATRGTRSSCHWPGDRGGNSLACLRPTVNARHESRAMC